MRFPRTRIYSTPATCCCCSCVVQILCLTVMLTHTQDKSNGMLNGRLVEMHTGTQALYAQWERYMSLQTKETAVA